MIDLLNSAADIIRGYNSDLASAFLAHPFRRVDIARAFSRGFVEREDQDPPEHCVLVLRVALADRENRRLNAELSS